MRIGKLGAWLFKGAMLVCVSGLILAGEQTEQPKTTTVETLYSIKDPATGKLRPMTVAERDAAGLPALLERDDRKSTQHTTKEGAGYHHLNGGFQSAVIVRFGQDGKVEQTCVDSMEGMRAFVAKKPEKEDSNVR